MCIKKLGIEINGIWAIVIVISFLIIIGAGAFYWYEWRPNQIRKECYDSAIKNPFNFYNTESERRAGLNFVYGNCLKMHGLEK